MVQTSQSAWAAQRAQQAPGSEVAAAPVTGLAPGSPPPPQFQPCWKPPAAPLRAQRAPSAPAAQSPAAPSEPSWPQWILVTELLTQVRAVP